MNMVLSLTIFVLQSYVSIEQTVSGWSNIAASLAGSLASTAGGGSMMVDMQIMPTQLTV
jgi:hypothetical protein